MSGETKYFPYCQRWYQVQVMLNPEGFFLSRELHVESVSSSSGARSIKYSEKDVKAIQRKYAKLRT
jgi:hypothetical protein